MKKYELPKNVASLRADGFEETLTEFAHLLRHGDITDAIVVFRYKDNDEHKLGYNWMGESSSVMCLGLCDYLAMHVRDWIRDTFETEGR